MKNLLFLLCAFISNHFIAQESKKIDQIFLDWNQAKHPGGVVLVCKGGKIVYSKALGSSNIQNGNLNTLNTTFNLASVSKQFTALGISILSQEGRVKIDDRIQVYLPELPDFGHEISIRNLLHHTSGLRSTPELFSLAGWIDSDTIKTENVFKYLCKQTDLNFIPGTEFMYSNSNYVLLAMIIQRITGEDFSKWMKSHVFDPLGMINTFIDASNSNTISTACVPYFEIKENQFKIANNTSHDIGASNVYSTAPDLMIWLQLLNNPEEKWASSVKFLLTTETLISGMDNNYARGLIVDEYIGNRRIYHNGGIPGNLSFAINFPDDDLSVVVLTNYLDVKAQKRIEKLLTLYIKDKSKKRKKAKKIKPVSLDTVRAINYCADYWNKNKNYSRSVFLKNDTLWYSRTNGSISQLIQMDDSCFIIGGIGSFVEVQFKTQNGLISMYVKDENKQSEVFNPYVNSSISESELKKYCGTFYSPELETRYTITLDGQKIIGNHKIFGFFNIEVLKIDVVDWSGFAIANYKKDKLGQVTGFFVSIDRVKNVWFEKEEEEVHNKQK